MATYHFVKVTDKTLSGDSTWYFVAKNESQLKEHWEKYAGSEIKEGVRELVGKLDGSFYNHWTNSFASITATMSELSNLPYFIKSTQLENELYIMWDGGKHWYAKIGKIDIVDSKGNQKWNTKEEAESAAREYINLLK